MSQYLQTDEFQVVWRLSEADSKRHIGIDVPYPLAKAIKQSAKLNQRPMQVELIEVLEYYYLDVRLPESS